MLIRVARDEQAGHDQPAREDQAQGVGDEEEEEEGCEEESESAVEV